MRIDYNLATFQIPVFSGLLENAGDWLIIASFT
uniref:Uncharacterized protein n=1 Tax=Arundo donax TaxID=35708 RepID=A0A0A8Y6Q2_ARUDO